MAVALCPICSQAEPSGLAGLPNPCREMADAPWSSDDPPSRAIADRDNSLIQEAEADGKYYRLPGGLLGVCRMAA